MSAECIQLSGPGGSSAQILPALGFNCFAFRTGKETGYCETLWAEEGFAQGDKRPSGSGIPLLFPFPGRIRGTHFSWQGQDYALGSDDGRGNAIHGFVLNRAWRVLEQTNSEVEAEFHVSVDDPQLLDCWPADFRIRIRYRLLENSLRADIRIDNPDTRPLPCGLGTHPYFRLAAGGAAESCSLQIPVAAEWELQEMLPTGNQAATDACRALSQGKELRGAQFDNVFTGLTFQQGNCTTAVEDPTSGRRIVQRFSDAFRECVVYTPPHRAAVCIEPYTCLPAGQGLAESGIDTGWQILPPAALITAQFEIAVELMEGE